METKTTEGPANVAWGKHVDTCEVCPTIPEGWCPEGSALLDAAVAELKLEDVVAEEEDPDGVEDDSFTGLL